MEQSGSEAPSSSPSDRPHRLTGADAFRLHLTLSLGLVLCIGAFTFELIRALDGHTFSWMYVFEWPLFAAFALYMWWNLLNGNDRRRPDRKGPSVPPHGSEGVSQPEDEDLAAWNRYLHSMESEETEVDRSGGDR